MITTITPTTRPMIPLLPPTLSPPSHSVSLLWFYRISICGSTELVYISGDRPKRYFG
jgi:hypothetical protein